MINREIGDFSDAYKRHHRLACPSGKPNKPEATPSEPATIRGRSGVDIDAIRLTSDSLGECGKAFAQL